MYLKQHGDYNFTNIHEMLKYVHKQFRHDQCCVRKHFVPMKVVINVKSKLCIFQTTSKTLLCDCSLVFKIVQHVKHKESFVRKFLAPMKYVINGKYNLCIPQRARKTLLLLMSC